MDSSTIQCSQTTIDRITALMQTSDEDALTAIDEAMAQWPSDARLHLLRGAMLAHQTQYDEARTALSRAVVLAPALDMARLMLGQLEVTENRPAEAVVTFRPLAMHGNDEATRLFATGMIDLLEGRLSAAAENLQASLSTSPPVPALASHVHALLKGIDEALHGQNDETPSVDSAANHFLLGDYLRDIH